jgi:hypothetical protein
MEIVYAFPDRPAISKSFWFARTVALTESRTADRFSTAYLILLPYSLRSIWI